VIREQRSKIAQLKGTFRKMLWDLFVIVVVNGVVVVSTGDSDPPVSLTTGNSDPNLIYCMVSLGYW
jgi:hypothetical protein